MSPHLREKSLPPKLRYNGCVYHLAETEHGRLWRKEIAPRLKQCFDLAADADLRDHEKKEKFLSVWKELREYLKLLGL